MESDSSGVEVLGREECLALLSTVSVGRLAGHIEALPLIMPVSFAVSDAGLLLRTSRGSQLDLATRDAVVAFEADDIGPGDGGWTVAVTGIASEVPDGQARNRFPELAPDRWGGTAGDRWVRVSLELVSGRRIVPYPARTPHRMTTLKESSARAAGRGWGQVAAVTGTRHSTTVPPFEPGPISDDPPRR